MLRFITRILISTIILTVPLSNRGDNCPEIRPGFTRQPQVQESRHVTNNWSTAVQSLPDPSAQSIIASTIFPLQLSNVQLKSLPLLKLHDYAPPNHSFFLIFSDKSLKNSYNYIVKANIRHSIKRLSFRNDFSGNPVFKEFNG